MEYLRVVPTDLSEGQACESLGQGQVGLLPLQQPLPLPFRLLRHRDLCGLLRPSEEVDPLHMREQGSVCPPLAGWRVQSRKLVETRLGLAQVLIEA